MNRIEEGILPAPIPPMCGDEMVVGHESHFVDTGHDGDGPMRVRRRHGVTVAVEANQGE
jgi:hypothetical protein